MQQQQQQQQELVWVDVRPTSGCPVWPALKMNLVGQQENKENAQQVRLMSSFHGHDAADLGLNCCRAPS